MGKLAAESPGVSIERNINMGEGGEVSFSSTSSSSSVSYSSSSSTSEEGLMVVTEEASTGGRVAAAEYGEVEFGIKGEKGARGEPAVIEPDAFTAGPPG